MNKYTDDQSTPAKSSHEEEALHSTQLPSITTELRNQSIGMLKVDENECKVEESTPVKKFWRKPSDMPKRPMSSYNIFYRMERERLVEGGRPRLYTTEDVNQFVAKQRIKDESPKPKRKHRRTHGKISFTDLARVIASNWKNMNDAAKMPFHERAVIEKKAYTAEITEWNKTKKTPGMRGTKRKADDPIHQKQEKLQTPNLPVVDGKDLNYEMYSDGDSNISHDATDVNIHTTGIDHLEDPLTGVLVRQINQTQNAYSLPLHRRQEHLEHGRISTRMTFDSIHHHDDMLSAGGTLNRSRSLSDITDYEELALPNRRLIGQHNFSVHDEIHPSLMEPHGSIVNTRIDSSNLTGHENHNSRFLPKDTEQVFVPSVSQQILMQPQVCRMSEETILNRYTSQHVPSVNYNRDQFAQNSTSTDQFTGITTNSGQEYFQNFDDPTQRNIRIGSYANDSFHLQSTNLSRLHQMGPQSNMSTAITMTQRNYSFPPHCSPQMVRHDMSGNPGQAHPQQIPHQERPADFVTSFEDVQIGYAVLSPQAEPATQSNPHSHLSSPHLFQRANGNHDYNLQRAPYQVPQLFSTTQPSLPHLHRSSDNHAVNQSMIFHQPNDRNFNAQQGSGQATQPYRNIASSQLYVQHLNDNNAINQSRAMFPTAQHYAPAANNNSAFATNDNGTQLPPQPSGFAEAQQQGGDYQHNQSSDESQFWEF